jgi:hypothetical protein
VINAYITLVRKPKGRYLERLNNRWEDGMDLRQIGCEVVDWIYLAQDREQWQALTDTVINILGISCLAERLLISQDYIPFIASILFSNV